MAVRLIYHGVPLSLFGVGAEDMECTKMRRDMRGCSALQNAKEPQTRYNGV
ncbi:hypothetical protein SAMN05518856_101491 [Paenibacillus sp. OK003]|nr:hypothetical protein SAMN05518856_101491 [Paenibacillus sp. OK003]